MAVTPTPVLSAPAGCRDTHTAPSRAMKATVNHGRVLGSQPGTWPALAGPGRQTAATVTEGNWWKVGLGLELVLRSESLSGPSGSRL